MANVLCIIFLFLLKGKPIRLFSLLKLQFHYSLIALLVQMQYICPSFRLMFFDQITLLEGVSRTKPPAFVFHYFRP